MALNIRQQQFIDKVQETASVFVDLVNDMGVLKEQWADEFSSGKTNEILAEDVLAFGLTPFKIGQIQTVYNQLINFWNNSTVTAQDNAKFMRNLLNKHL